MSDMLKTLSGYQMQALDKGIDFSLNLHFNHEHVPFVDVTVYCYTPGDTTETHSFSTTVSEDYCDSKNKHRINGINTFLESIKLYSE